MNKERKCRGKGNRKREIKTRQRISSPKGLDKMIKKKKKEKKKRQTRRYPSSKDGK